MTQPEQSPKQPSNTGRAGIARKVTALLEPAVVGAGFALWDLQYVKEGSDRVLRVTIDKPDGITVDDCETVTRLVDPILDEADPIPDSYILEVCSPGVERELTRAEHFEAMKGQTVCLHLFAALNGSRTLTGTLCGLSDSGDILVTVGSDSQPTPVARSLVSSVRTVYDFSADL